MDVDDNDAGDADDEADDELKKLQPIATVVPDDNAPGKNAGVLVLSLKHNLQLIIPLQASKANLLLQIARQDCVAFTPLMKPWRGAQNSDYEMDGKFFV